MKESIAIDGPVPSFVRADSNSFRTGLAKALTRKADSAVTVGFKFAISTDFLDRFWGEVLAVNWP
jgi:hypothetical protein